MATPEQSNDGVSSEQHQMLALIYDAFAPTGQWPLFGYVSAHAWTELQADARKVYYELGQRELVRPPIKPDREFELREDTQVGVSLLGLTYVPKAAEDLGRFVAAVRYIADRAARFQPSSPTEVERLSVTSEEIRLHLGLEPSDPALVRLGALISDEAWQISTSFSRLGSADWSFDANLERARRYTDIFTVFDFLAGAKPQPPAPLMPVSITAPTLAQTASITENRKVMVVHGRDLAARDDLFSLLKALGLEPIEWSDAVRSTGKGAPYNAEAVEAAFRTAQAAVILLTQEEQVVLREDLRDPKDPTEADVAWQPRPNVFYEGGIAFTSHPDRTIILELARPRVATDLAGRNAVRINSTSNWREDLANRLRDAGCPVDTANSDWRTAGTFAEPELSPGSGQAKSH